MDPRFAIWVDGFVSDSSLYFDERTAIARLHDYVTDDTTSWILWKMTTEGGAAEQVGHGTGRTSLPPMPHEDDQEVRMRQGVAEAWRRFADHASPELVADVSQRLDVQLRAGMEAEAAALARGQDLVDRLTVLDQAGVVNEETEGIITELALLGASRRRGIGPICPARTAKRPPVYYSPVAEPT